MADTSILYNHIRFKSYKIAISNATEVGNIFVSFHEKACRYFTLLTFVFNVCRMWLEIFLVFVIICILAYLDTKKPKNFPPGPDWIPILGSALAIQKLRNQTGFLYQACAELSREYGPVVGLRVGKDRQVVCFGYPAIKEMLSKEDFDGRPRGPFYETRTWGKRQG